MQLLSNWWRGTTSADNEPIAAASVVERNYTQQKRLEVKAKQAEHKAKKARQEAAIKAKQNGGETMAKQLLKQARLLDRQALRLRQQVTSLASQSIILDEATTNAEIVGLKAFIKAHKDKKGMAKAVAAARAKLAKKQGSSTKPTSSKPFGSGATYASSKVKTNSNMA